MRTDSMLVGAALVALLAATAEADTLKVPKDFATIQEAVDAAVAEDIVLVSKGTWAPFTVSGKTDITIRGKGKPLIDGGDLGTTVVFVDKSEHVELTGFRVAHGAGFGVEVSDSCSFITISKCRFEDVDDACIDLDGSDHFVEKCRFEGVGGDAISLQPGSTGASLEKNRMIDVDTAISFLGSGHLATKNKVKDARNEGFVITAVECVITKNRFDTVDDDALDVEGDDNTFVLNRVKHAGSNGVELEPADGEPFPVTGNLFEKNKVMHSVVNGFFVGTTGNTFVLNKAKHSGNFDLVDTTGPGGNTYTDNTFGTELFP